MALALTLSESFGLQPGTVRLRGQRTSAIERVPVLRPQDSRSKQALPDSAKVIRHVRNGPERGAKRVFIPIHSGLDCVK